MACNFSIDFNGSADAFVAKIKQQIEDAHGTFNGDDSSGSFSVPIPASHIDGDYTIQGQTITIDITSKPFFVSCGAIESYIKNHMTSAAVE